jgi:hypothetical protein
VTLLDQALPEWHFRERHSQRVDAAPERVFRAIDEVTLGEMPVARALVRLRGMRGRVSRPLLDEMRDVGFEVEAEEPGREVAYASVGQPWKLRGGIRPNVADFRSFAEPGYAKMAFNFRLEGAVLTTETRVFLTDDRSRRLFRRYWLFIRPFSGLIRRVWLRAIARRAED